MKKKLLFFCISVTVLQSCKKDADVKLPYVEPKLVVSSFISPQDSLILVAVSLSHPLYNNPAVSQKYDPVIDANVTISNANGSYHLTYDSKIKRYVIDSSKLKIIAGIRYDLSVSSSDGKFVSATTSIPFPNNSMQFVVTKNNGQKDQYNLNVTWQDAPDEIDYYKFEVRYTSYYLYTGSSSTNGSFIDTIKYWGGQPNYFTDSGNQGGVFNVTDFFKYRTGKNDTVFASLSTVTKEYKDYYEKLGKAIGIGDSFTEPVEMYTNINNGLGIFAGLNKYRLQVCP